MKKKLMDFAVTFGVCIVWAFVVAIMSVIISDSIMVFFGIASFICLIIAILKYYDIPFKID